MIVTTAQMLAAEKAAFARGILAEHLMEDAGRGITAAIQQYFPTPQTLVVYLGKGNNAGDALVVARLLMEQGWTVLARCAGPTDQFSPLPAALWSALEGRIHLLPDATSLHTRRGNLVLLDGLLGLGARPEPLTGAYASLVEEMNALRRRRHAFTVAIDVPTGLEGHDEKAASPCVEADLTVTVAHVKEILLGDSATKFVGRLAVAPLPELRDAAGDDKARALTPATLLPTLPRRSFEHHKGVAGRVGVIAGSRGYLGAGIMAASAALRGGAGLITLYVPEADYALFSAQTPPEVMVRPVADYRVVLEQRHDVLALGPGLGQKTEGQVLEIIKQSECPTILDADALNIVAGARLGLDALKSMRRPTLMTPHPGEMARLIRGLPKLQKLGRRELVTQLASGYTRVTWLYKGSRTVIATSGEPVSFNTTGHPGMATGGMGDVLTGLCAALVGQGMSLYDGACLGAWLSGRAAEIALLHGESQESVSPLHVLTHLGAAFRSLKALDF